METIEGVITEENTMSFEESLKQISPSDNNAKPIKISLLKQLRKRYYWRLENNQWVVYDKKQNREFTIKTQRKPTYFSRWSCQIVRKKD